MVRGYQVQIGQVNGIASHYEQQRQHYQNQANYWNTQVQTWGITGYRWEYYRYKSGKRWKTGRRQVPVYGWIHSPQAQANRNAMQQAANVAAQMRDAANQQGKPVVATMQAQIAATQQKIGNLQQEVASLKQKP